MAQIVKQNGTVVFNEEHLKTFKSADEWLKAEPKTNLDFWKNDYGITDAELKTVYAQSTGTAEVSAKESK